MNNVKLPDTGPRVASHIEEDDLIYPVVHLDPKGDPIIRAICEKLGIDWRTLVDERTN